MIVWALWHCKKRGKQVVHQDLVGLYESRLDAEQEKYSLMDESLEAACTIVRLDTIPARLK